jgi:tetratricopeptide (TPR) repeat protein
LIRAALGVLLALSTLGEGGGSAEAIAAWHAGVVALVVLALLLRDPARGTLPGGVSWALAAFLALFAAGAVRAPYSYAALLSGLELSATLGVLFLAAAEGPGLIASLRPWLLGAGTAQAGLSIYQWGLGQRRPAGTFLNPNHLALWCAATLLVGLGSWLDGAPRRRRIVETSAFCAVGFPLLLTGSRGAFLGLAAGAAYLALARWQKLGPQRRREAGALVLLVLAAGAVRIWQRQGQADPFRWQRLRIWRASLELPREEPLWGSGPGQFALAAARFTFPDGEPPWRFDRSFGTPHSDALRLPCEFGLPAALAAWSALALALAAVWRARKSAGGSAALHGAQAALLAIGVQALFDDPTSWPAVYLLAAALAGAVLSRPGGRPARGARAVRAAAALGLCAVYVGSDLAPFVAWRAARDLPRGRLDPAGQARLASALALNPIHPDLWRRRAEHLAGDGTAWDLDAYAAARAAAERAVRLSPRDARMWRQLAQVETLAFRTLLHDAATRDRAARAYRQAESLEPHNPFLAVDLAKLLVDGGDAEGARRAAERALELEPESALPRLLLADALLAARAPGAAARASALLDEASQKVSRWAAADRSAYGRGLLSVDPRIVSRLRGDIERIRR